MNVEDVLVMVMVIGGWVTFFGILIFLPSSHKREKQHGKQNAWNPKDY